MSDFFSPILEATILRHELEQQTGLAAYRFGEMLVQEGIISQAELRSAIALQKHDGHKKIGNILVEMGALGADTVEAALTRRLGIPFVGLAHFDFEPQALQLVSMSVAKKHELIPCMLHRNRLVVAVAKPLEQESLELLRFITGKQIEVVMAARDEIIQAIEQHYPQGVPKPQTQQAHHPDAAIGKFLDSIIRNAIRRHASGITISPGKEAANISFVIDGHAVSVIDFDKKILHDVIELVKELGMMNTREHFLRQEGRAVIMEAGEIHHLQIATAAGQNGESASLRLSPPDMH